jgi:hypothetical protein
MSALQDESRIGTTGELITGWERVLLGEVTYGKTLEERRLFLETKDSKLNRAEMEKIARMYGLSIAGVTFPYRPAFFGHARFTTSFLAGPAGFSVLLITALRPKAEFYALFIVRPFGTTHFGQDRLSWSPLSPHFAKAFTNYIVREKQLFKDFEQALQSGLLVNQMAFFSYEGV